MLIDTTFASKVQSLPQIQSFQIYTHLHEVKGIRFEFSNKLSWIPAFNVAFLDSLYKQDLSVHVQLYNNTPGVYLL